MLPEETFNVRCKFAHKILDRIRAQRATKAIHGIRESSVMPWVVGVLQRTAGQSPQELGRVECAVAFVVSGDHHSGCGVPHPGHKRSLARRKVARILMQDCRSGKSLD